MHGVFSSLHKKSASSRTSQFHQAYIGDSKAVVTPFMQVGTYPTRNFATFGPSELRPPFTGIYKKSLHFFFSFYSTGQASDPIHRFSTSQSPMFLINSRRFFFSDILSLIEKILLLPKLQS